MIYHITNTKGFLLLFSTGKYVPEAFSQDGFVHCSTKDQVIRTANNYFSGINGLLLFEIDEREINSHLVFENLEGGKELFPHIYSPIPLQSITQIAFLKSSNTGFIFPETWYSATDFANMVK